HCTLHTIYPDHLHPQHFPTRCSSDLKAENIIADLRQRQLESENAPAVKEHEFIDAQTQLSNLRQEEENLQKNKVLQREKEKQTLKEGQTVTVHSLGQTGTLVEKIDNEWVVQMGMLKMR